MTMICVNGFSARGNILRRVPSKYIAWGIFVLLAENDNVSHESSARGEQRRAQVRRPGIKQRRLVEESDKSVRLVIVVRGELQHPAERHDVPLGLAAREASPAHDRLTRFLHRPATHPKVITRRRTLGHGCKATEHLNGGLGRPNGHQHGNRQGPLVVDYVWLVVRDVPV